MAKTWVLTYTLQISFNSEKEIEEFEKVLKMIWKMNKKAWGKTYIEKENTRESIYDNMYDKQSTDI